MKNLVNLTLATALSITAGFAGTAQAGGSLIAPDMVLTANAAEKPMPQTREHILLGRQVGVPKTGATGTLSNGTAGKADMIVTAYAAGNSGLPGAGFCGPWNGGNPKIRMNVQNTGGTVSEPTSLTLRFKKPNGGGWDGAVINLPKIGAGQSKAIFYPVPAWAWAPGHHSSITFAGAVDASQFVAESNEGNNAYGGSCMGPAG